MRRACLQAGDLPPPYEGSGGEMWMDIQTHPDYAVSSLGRVKSRKRGAERILRGGTSASGYCTVNLYRKDGMETHLVHHLVACHFHSRSYKNGLIITHLNGNQKDNRAENLSWRSHAENMLDKREHGTMYWGEANSFSKLKEHQVYEIKRSKSTTRELALRFGVDWLTVHRVRTGESWKHLEN